MARSFEQELFVVVSNPEGLGYKFRKFATTAAKLASDGDYIFAF
jgi:hypothetical protein